MTPDLVELMRRFLGAANSGLEGFVSFHAPDAVWDMSHYGMGTYEGLAAIRSFYQGWLDAFEDFAVEAKEVSDLGQGVAFAVLTQTAHPRGSPSEVRVPYATVTVWSGGLVGRVTMYDDIDEARAAAERLAQERG